MSREAMGHKSEAFVVHGNSDWYRCSCGGTYGRRDWPESKAKPRMPVEVGPTFFEHVMEAEGFRQAERGDGCDLVPAWEEA